MKTKEMQRPCGNPHCSTSTGIHEGLTFGWGELDDYGYWEHPCAICARDFDEKRPELQKTHSQEKPENVEWLYISGWPFPDQDISELEKQWKENHLDREDFSEEFEELFGLPD